jgi:hypothetical protein
MAQKQEYVPPVKEVYQSFGSKINAASMDDRFLIGTDKRIVSYLQD